jgi:hypothetical protein
LAAATLIRRITVAYAGLAADFSRGAAAVLRGCVAFS